MTKYLVASSGDTLDSKVSNRFGHSGYFLIVDPETMEYKSLPGVSNYENQSFVKYDISDISKVIIGNIGPALFNRVKASGCKIYLCRNMPVPEAIKKVRNGEIPELEKPTLNESIHSARKTGYNYGGHGKGLTGKVVRGLHSGEKRGPGNIRSTNKEPAARKPTLRSR